MKMSIYLPREDSFLIQIAVKDFAFGKVLDIGTGSGIQAVTAASKKDVKKVVGVDINKKAIDYCKREVKHRKIKFSVSNLFSKVKEKFDTIIFNPPYLPADEYPADVALIGGKKGYETVERFLDSANKHLNSNGLVILLFSSLTGKEKVEEIIGRNAFVFEKVQEKSVGLMETLYVYVIKKSDLLKTLEKKGLSDVKELTKGHRGVIYTAKYKNKKVAVKTQRPDIQVKSISTEISGLKKLQKYKIGPKLLFAGTDFFVYEFVEGKFIEDFIEKANKTAIKSVLKNVLFQCRKLDELHLTKEEMQNPYKHVIVGKKPVLIDFERCKYSPDPKNVTQFCQYLIGGKITRLLEKKGIKIDKMKTINLAREYKNKPSVERFKKLSALVK